MKKAGQEEVVKLFPIPASKGLGSAFEDAVETDEVDEDAVVELCARLRKCCMYGSGGVLLSNRRTLSMLARACIGCPSSPFGVAAASTHGLQKHKRMIRQASVHASREKPVDAFATCRHTVNPECEYEVCLTREEAFKNVGAVVSESTSTVKSFRHLDEAPHLFIPAAAS